MILQNSKKRKMNFLITQIDHLSHLIHLFLAATENTRKFWNEQKIAKIQEMSTTSWKTNMMVNGEVKMKKGYIRESCCDYYPLN